MESMNGKKRKTNKSKKKLNLVVILSALALILGGIVFGVDHMQNDDNPTNPDIVDNDSEGNVLYSTDTKSFTIKTPYCDLAYPEAWKDVVSTEYITGDSEETIQFWAQLEGKEKVHLFDIIFGGDSYIVGRLQINDDEEITVNVVSHSFTPDDTWTEDEKTKIYTMMEDVNYILFQLEELEEYYSIY